MTGPFSDEKSKVRYVLVDNVKFEIKPEDRPGRTKGRFGSGDAQAPDGEVVDRPGPAGRGGPGGRRPRGDATEKGRPAGESEKTDTPEKRRAPRPERAATARSSPALRKKLSEAVIGS